MTSGVYLDHNATTPICEEALEAMRPYWRGVSANASSQHAAGRQAREAVEQARAQVAAAVGARAEEVVFTSSGTESNNAIIKGVAKMSLKKTLAVAATEHPCVLCAARSLMGEGWRVEFLAVDGAGKIDGQDLAAALAQDCALVSVMTANNETGVLQDIPAIAAQVHAAGAALHTDAAQALGKVPVSFANCGADAMTISAHKCQGPKGVAALIAKRELAWAPLLEGGGHEDGRRSGTENVPGIVGFGKACELAAARAQNNMAATQKRRDNMEAALRAAGAKIFGAELPRLPNTCYFGFPNIGGDAMATMLDQSGFYVSAGAACSSMKGEASHVLLAMDIEPELATTAVRVSLGAETTDEEASAFAATCAQLASQMGGLAAVT